MDEDDGDYSPVIEMVIAWVKKYGTSWECEGDSSNRIKFAFERGGLSYNATAAEEEPVSLTLRVQLSIIGITDELQVHRILEVYVECGRVGSVTYHHTRAELVWRDTLFLHEEDLEEDDSGVKSVEDMIIEALAAFDAVRKKLAAVLHHTPTLADLSVMPAQGGRC